MNVRPCHWLRREGLGRDELEAESPASFQIAKRRGRPCRRYCARAARRGGHADGGVRNLARAESAFSKLLAAAPDDPAAAKSRRHVERVRRYLSGEGRHDRSAQGRGDERGDCRALVARTAMIAFAQAAGARPAEAGDAMRELGEVGEARKRTRVGSASLAATDGDSVARREVAVALTAGQPRGEREQLRDSQETLLEIAGPALELAKEREAWRRDVVLGHIVLGDVLLELGESAAAGENFVKAVVLADGLQKEDPTNTKVLRDLAVGSSAKAIMRSRSRSWRVRANSTEQAARSLYAFRASTQTTSNGAVISRFPMGSWPR